MRNSLTQHSPSSKTSQFQRPINPTSAVSWRPICFQSSGQLGETASHRRSLRPFRWDGYCSSAAHQTCVVSARHSASTQTLPPTTGATSTCSLLCSSVVMRSLPKWKQHAQWPLCAAYCTPHLSPQCFPTILLHTLPQTTQSVQNMTAPLQMSTRPFLRLRLTACLQ